MESKKRKALILGGLLLISAILLILTFSDTNVSQAQEPLRKEVSLRANTDDVSLEDIIKNQENKRPADAVAEDAMPMQSDISSSVGDDPAAVARVQALIRATEANQESGLREIENERRGINTVLPNGNAEGNNAAFSSYAGSSRSRHSSRRETALKTDTVAEIVAVKPQKRSPFNSISLSSTTGKNAIKAYVHSEQTVMAGSTLKMRLGEDAMADGGVLIPKNSPVFGEVTGIDGERVNVRITHINYQGNILPFEKLVYSKDALLGIYVPGNPKSDANTDVTGGVLDGLPANLPGIETASQIAGAVAGSAVAAGKQALSKNVRKIKVTIKTNYEIYLRPDEKRN